MSERKMLAIDLGASSGRGIVGTFNGKTITDEMHLKIALQNYHYLNFENFFGIPFKEVEKNAKPRVVASSINNIIEEYMSTHPRLDAHVEGRLVVLE